MDDSKLKSIIEKYEKENPEPFSLISLNYILFYSPLEELIQFSIENAIKKVGENTTRNEVVYRILDHFRVEYNKKDPFKAKYPNLVSYLGNFLYNGIPYVKEMKCFDFISKIELLNIFADFCSDLNIYVYKTEKKKEEDIDLFLTKKTKGVVTTTESVFVLNGDEVEALFDEDLFDSIQESKKITDWTVFCTTPQGCQKIGFNRMVNQLEKLNSWLYIIDPIKKRIIGVMKGSKSKSVEIKMRDDFLKNLPTQPFRSPSQLSKFSKYEFNEKNAYKLKNTRNFGLNSDYIEGINENLIKDLNKYREFFQSLLIVDKNSGLTLYSYSKEEAKFDDLMVSGFLSAVNSFAAELSGTSGLEELNYKGFVIYEKVGKSIKTIAVMSKSADPSFKERLSKLTSFYETKYVQEIEHFTKSGETILESPKMNSFIQRYLGV